MLILRAKKGLVSSDCNTDQPLFLQLLGGIEDGK